MCTSRILRRRRLAAVIATLVLVAAACGDDSSDEAAVEDSTTTITSDLEPQPTIENEPEPSAPLAATDIGVTESVIKVGVVFPDTALIGRDPGDLEAKFLSIADAVNEGGGINGRDLEVSFRLTNPIDFSTFERVCVELTQDIGVFAAIGTFLQTTADCYPELNDTIVINTFGIGEDQMASYTAPGITTEAHPARLVDARVAALLDGGVVEAGMPIAVVGGEAATTEHEQYIDALEAAGVDVVASSIVLGDGQDLVALSGEMATYTEVWKASGAEAVLATVSLVSQALLIGYNEGDIDLPILLPQGTGVNPSLLRDQQGLDLAPFELATALVDGDSQAAKYETGADGVRECVDSFQAASGEEVALDESRNNLGPTIIACQVFDIFVQVAEAAGPELTTESFAAAAEAFGPIEVTDLASSSLGPGKFDLDDSVGVIAEFDPETAQFRPVG